MENEPLGTKRTGIYAPPPKRPLGLYIGIAAAAVAVLLFFTYGNRKEVGRVDPAGTPSGVGRRPVNDSTLRPNATPRPDDPARNPARSTDGIVPREDELTPLPADRDREIGGVPNDTPGPQPMGPTPDEAPLPPAEPPPARP